MEITILTTGTRGDTQPYVALGLELMKLGHSVRVAAFGTFEDLVTSHGLGFYPIRGDITQVISSAVAEDAIKADNPLKFALSFKKLRPLVFNLQRDFFHACIGSDAIVYHPGAPIGYFAAKYLKVPSVLATPFPMTPTTQYPSLIFYDRIRLGRAFNLLTHTAFERIMWLASSSAVKDFWKQEFGMAPADFGCPFSRQNTRTLPTVISCSQHVFPRPNDWSEHVHLTGYWFLDDAAGWKPPDALLDFLQSGTPPIYVGFGSVADPSSAAKTTELVVNSLRQSGQRGVLATGWHGLSVAGDLDEDIFALDSAPHSWLFPRMAAVVHHGGAGTTAAGLRAGIPSIIIPYGNDQFAWGRRIYELGVGGEPIPRRALTAEKLSERIRFVLTTRRVQSASKDLAERIGGEHGAAAAAQIIDDCLKKQRE